MFWRVDMPILYSVRVFSNDQNYKKTTDKNYQYSCVRNKSSLSGTCTARSTEPRLSRFLILICREHKNMSLFFGTVSPSCLLWLCWPSIVEYKTLSKSCSDWQFYVVQFDDDVRDVYTKKTADKIAVEGNCWGGGGVSVWVAWRACFPQFLGRKWKRRRANLGLFLILSSTPPPAGGFSKFVLVADKWILK